MTSSRIASAICLAAALRYKRPVYLEIPRDRVQTTALYPHQPSIEEPVSDPAVLRGETLLLWGAPIVLFLAGATAMVLFVRKRGGTPTGVPLSEAEKAELERALKRD